MSLDLQPTLENDLVLLRPLIKQDFDALYEVAKDPLIWKQHPSWDRYKREVFGKFFQDSLMSRAVLVVIDQKTKQTIGSSRFKPMTKTAVEIGWSFLARKYWGGVYNRAVKTLMLNYAFETMEYVVFYIDKANIRSQKAVEKIGGKKLIDPALQYLKRQKNIDYTYYLQKRDLLHVPN